MGDDFSDAAHGPEDLRRGAVAANRIAELVMEFCGLRVKDFDERVGAARSVGDSLNLASGWLP